MLRAPAFISQRWKSATGSLGRDWPRPLPDWPLPDWPLPDWPLPDWPLPLVLCWLGWGWPLPGLGWPLLLAGWALLLDWALLLG